ncbi:hypothetical protein [Sphingobium yanoikuyae]|uniref:hypothetical protein n=1 Tax=Sphingobium yanoikuyae TaxID=13690 RepID=UPI003F0F7FC1
MSIPQPIDTAPKDGGWILGRVRVDPKNSWQQPWVIMTWGDCGWTDNEGDEHAPIEWVSLPDPQPSPTGWTPPSGTIRICEITGEGWTSNGQPIKVPYRWEVYIEKPDGSYDEYRESWHDATLEGAQLYARKWQQRFGLPIMTVHLDKKILPFRLAVTKQ